MTRTAALLPALSIAPSPDRALWIFVGAIAGIIIGVVGLALILRKAIENEIGRWFGWCVLICAVALTVYAQRIPGRRVPTQQPTMDIVRFVSEQYPPDLGGGPMEVDGTKFTFKASDGLTYSCTMRASVCDTIVPHGVDFTKAMVLAGTKTVTIADKISIGGVKPPDPPAVRKGRGRVVLPPMNIPVGEELHAMPPPVLLNFITKSTAPGTYIVIMSSDGKTFIIWQVQGGLPMQPGWRKVWP